MAITLHMNSTLCSYMGGLGLDHACMARRANSVYGNDNSAASHTNFATDDEFLRAERKGQTNCEETNMILFESTKTLQALGPARRHLWFSNACWAAATASPLDPGPSATCTNTQTHRHRHSLTQIHTDTNTHRDTQTKTLTQTQTHTHTHTHTHTLTHLHTHSCTQTQADTQRHPDTVTYTDM